MLIDSHCHINHERLSDEKEFILKNMREQCIESAINVGYDEASSRESVRLAKENAEIFAAVGMHPHDASKLTAQFLYEIEELCKEEKTLAVGEIGLDYHYDLSPREEQKKAFVEQLRLAHAIKKPVIIHLRDAYKDMEDLLKENEKYIEYGLLLHCYSGSVESVAIFNRFDCYYALGGSVTFSKKGKEVADVIPRNRLLLETDSPYLTPVPYRGQKNYPHYVRTVAKYLATVTGESCTELEDRTYENTKRFFHMK